MVPPIDAVASQTHLITLIAVFFDDLADFASVVRASPSIRSAFAHVWDAFIKPLNAIIEADQAATDQEKAEIALRALDQRGVEEGRLAEELSD